MHYYIYCSTLRWRRGQEWMAVIPKYNKKWLVFFKRNSWTFLFSQMKSLVWVIFITKGKWGLCSIRSADVHNPVAFEVVNTPCIKSSSSFFLPSFFNPIFLGRCVFDGVGAMVTGTKQGSVYRCTFTPTPQSNGKHPPRAPNSPPQRLALGLFLSI